MNNITEATLKKSDRGEWVRLFTLTYLRWMAVIGQTFAVVIGYFILKLDFSILICLSLILVSSLLNLLSSFYFPKTKRLSEFQNMLLLLYDLLQLGLMLYFTGGLTNPFAVFILGPVIISATVLNLRFTTILGSIAILIVIILSFLFHPIMYVDGEILEPPRLLLVGNLVAISIAIVFIALYSRRVANETFSMSQALQAMQMTLEREQRLSSLGAIVAAAAHEMGTPLATIKLISTELKHGFNNKNELHADLSLISSQVDRCRDILRNIGRKGKDDIFLRNMPIMVILQEVCSPIFNPKKKEIHFSLNNKFGKDIGDFKEFNQPILARKPELIYGLRNIIQNAIEFSKNKVWIDVTYNIKSLNIFISDDGNGYPSNLLKKIGEPFLNESNFKKNFKNSRPYYEGMGLGLFIAKTLLENLDATVTFSNEKNRKNEKGAIVRIMFEREKIEVNPDGKNLKDKNGKNEAN